MRLKQLHIENFRALEKKDIVFHPMAVIVGENDVGKTSCMLAIQTLFERKKLEDRNDYFKAETHRTVIIGAYFDCPTPSEAQAEFVCSGTIRVKCRYWVAGRDTHTDLDLDVAEWWIESGRVDEFVNKKQLENVLGRAVHDA